MAELKKMGELMMSQIAFLEGEWPGPSGTSSLAVPPIAASAEQAVPVPVTPARQFQLASSAAQTQIEGSRVQAVAL